MKETQFRKGQRSANWKPVGTILPDADGYLRIKVREHVEGEASGFGNAKVWQQLHHKVWIENKGPIPEGHVVTFKDGNKGNCAFENLECVHRSVMAARNRMWNLYPPEVAANMQLVGVVKRRLRSKERERNAEKQNV